MNRKSKGFTLVEVLAVVFIISLLLSLAVGSVIMIMDNSKKKSNTLTENNIKKVANVYANEYYDSIVWNSETKDILYNCISVKSLVEMGYLKKEQVLNYEKSYVKIVSDNDNNILYEKIDDDSCKAEDYKDNMVKIPTSEKVCNKLTYSVSEDVIKNDGQALLASLDEGYNVYVNNQKIKKPYEDVKGKNAGTYSIEFRLEDGYVWSDKTSDFKTVNCSIQKASPDLILDSSGVDYTVGTKIVKLKSPISGTVYLKSSNTNYVTATFSNDGNVLENYSSIEANKEKYIYINMLATRNTNTYVTITIIPSDEYKNNYYSGSVIYTVGKIEKKALKKPDNSFCENINYDGTEQSLIYLKKYKGYKFSNYKGIDVKKHEITAVPQYGYVWEDTEGVEEIKFICEIKENEYVVTLDSQGATTIGTEKVFWDTKNLYLDEAFTKKMTTKKNPIIVPKKDGYKFGGYYTLENGSGNQIIGDNGNVVAKNVASLSKANIKLYAKWIPNTYNIIYYHNAGDSIGSTSCVYNEICKLKKYSKTFPSSNVGWSFYGWTDSTSDLIPKYNDEAEFVYDTVGNMKLRAIGVRSFEFYGGIAPTTKFNTEPIYQYWNPYSTKAENYTSITLPSSIEIPSWNFVGYTFGSNTTDPKNVLYDASKIGTFVKPAYNKSQVVRSLYERPLTIKFIANSGTGSMDNMVKNQYYNSGYASNNKNTGAKISPTDVAFTLSKNKFEKNGYSFTKWAEGSPSGTQYKASSSYKKLNPSVDSIKITQEMYALWNAKTYTITLNNQSATTAGTGKIYGKYDNGLYLKNDYINKMTSTENNITVPIKKGYTFDGYYTEKTGEGEKRINVQGFIENNFTSNTYMADTTLYANWIANQYKVKFDANGGSTPSETERIVTYGQNYGELPKTSKSDKIFGGWYTAKSGGTEIKKSTKVSIDKDHTLYARWKSKTKTIKLGAYNWNGTSSDCIDTKEKCERESVDISGYTTFSVTLKKYLNGEEAPSDTSWGEVELRQGTGGPEGKGSIVIHKNGKEDTKIRGGKYAYQKTTTFSDLKVSDYFSSSNVSLLCLAVGYTGKASCEITFEG